jgi:tetratricopeptide (TPR) repeat protein
MYRIQTLILSFSILAYACSPKTQPVKEEPTPPSNQVKVVERLTECTTFADLDYADRDKAETAYVVYKDFMKVKNYEEAFKYWKSAYYLAPGSNGKVKYQYEDGVILYTEFYNQAKTEAEKKAFVDTVMMIYDKRVECFGGQAYVDGRKAFDYYYKFPQYSTPEATFALFRQAVDAKGEDSDYFVINPFTKMLSDRVIEGKIPHEEGQAYAKTLLAAVKKGKANCKGNLCQAWETIESYAPPRLEALEGVDGFYDCDYYTDKYYPMFQADMENCETVELAYRRLLRGGCSLEGEALSAIQAVKDSACYVPPPPPGLLKQAYDCYTQGDYACAVDKFEAFVNKTDDTEKKAKYLLLIAKIYYGDIKNFPKSRKYALDAASYKDNWGEPYLLIGKLYASSGPLCGPGTGFDSQIVTWPAIDKFSYAKKIDPSMTDEANKWIRTYSQYMPSKEDIFVRSIKEGSKFTVGCWINETTRVRTP